MWIFVSNVLLKSRKFVIIQYKLVTVCVFQCFSRLTWSGNCTIKPIFLGIIAVVCKLSTYIYTHTHKSVYFIHCLYEAYGTDYCWCD